LAGKVSWAIDSQWTLCISKSYRIFPQPSS
jgi:hypothetical protein